MDWGQSHCLVIGYLTLLNGTRAMATVAVDASTVRITVNSTRELSRLIDTYHDYIAVIHQEEERHLVVYDARTMLEMVVDTCLFDAPHWRPQLSA